MSEQIEAPVDDTGSDSTLAGVPDAPADISTERKRRRSRSSASTAVREIAEQPSIADVARKKQATTTGWAESDIEAVQLLAGSVLLFATGRVAAVLEDESFKGSAAEIDAVSQPLARIITRHLKVKSARRGDLADALAIAAAVVAYTIRVLDARDRKIKASKSAIRPFNTPAVEQPAEAGAIVEPVQEGFVA